MACVTDGVQGETARNDYASMKDGHVAALVPETSAHETGKGSGKAPHDFEARAERNLAEAKRQLAKHSRA